MFRYTNPNVTSWRNGRFSGSMVEYWTSSIIEGPSGSKLAGHPKVAGSSPV